MGSESDRLYDLRLDRDYVALLYHILLERAPDAAGLDHYAGELAAGRSSRRDVLEQLLTSTEGRRRGRLKYRPETLFASFVELFPGDSFDPWVQSPPLPQPQLCECADPRKWLEPRWIAYLEPLGLSVLLEDAHRKPYEWAQALYGLEILGALQPHARCLGVGSGHEAILYWLANHVAEVVATDLYEGDWTERGALEGDPSVLVDPARYAPFPYRHECLRFLRMDGRELEFPDASFDFVFSLGSIEHFGGNAAAATAMRELARVCKPGGIVVLATELILNDRQHDEFFTLDELREHIVAASGMRLVQRPTFQVPAVALAMPTVMPDEAHQTPHLVLDFDGVLTTSVILFFRH